MDWWEKYFDDNYLKLYSYTENSAAFEVDGVLRMMNVTPPAKILDLCCGFGRHSLVLAQQGFEVTGIDISQSFLDYAEKKASEQGIIMQLEHRDMRAIGHTEEYDAIINLFTAFGFFDSEEEDLKVLQGVAKALKPDGQFVIDTLNRDFVIHSGQSRIEIIHHIINGVGSPRKLESSFRLYTLREMLDLFDRSGLLLTDVYGDFDGSLYTGKSPRMILVARRQS
jgi:2-polyprenyl-3-methyl-5-hydroxy-6-metoxy-1,4-benzoquinol methylase